MSRREKQFGMTAVVVGLATSVATTSAMPAMPRDAVRIHAPGSSTPAATHRAFAWPGVYDLVATGFPDGQRGAVIHIGVRDTSYALLSLQGPPGNLVSFKVGGDSAHVVWNLGSEEMFVDLRGTGDSLTGQWSTPDWQGWSAALVVADPRQHPGPDSPPDASSALA